MRKGARRQNDVIMWRNRFRVAEDLDEDLGVTKEGLRNLDFYLGHQLGDAFDSSDLAFEEIEAYTRTGRVLIENRMMVAVAQQMAAMVWRIPWFNLRPRRAMGILGDQARQNAENSLNMVLSDRRNNWLLHARLVAIMSKLWFGCLKSTYTPDLGIDPERAKEEELGEIVVELDPNGNEIVNFVGGPPMLDKDGQPIRRGNKFVVDNRNLADYYSVDFVFPDDLRIDPEGTNDSQDHGWIAHRMPWKFNDFMRSPLFSHKQEIGRAAHFMTKDGLSQRTRRHVRDSRLGHEMDFEQLDPTMADKDQMRLWVWQCWDTDEREVTYLVEGFEKVVAKFKYPTYIDTHPFSFAKIHENPGEFYPVVEATQARPLARANNEMLSMLLTHMSRFTRRYVAREGMFATAEKEKFKSGDDGNVIEFRRKYAAVDLQPVKDAPLDPAIYRLIEFMRAGMDEIMGSQRFPIAGVDSATEAAIGEGNSSARDNDSRGRLKECYERNADIMLKTMQKTLPQNMLISQMTPLGEFFERRMSRMQIAGDYDNYIELTEMEPHDDRQERADLNEVLQIGGLAMFASPTFAKKFWEARRKFDPQMVEELVGIGQAMLQAQMQSGQGQSQPGGPKPTGSGPDKGRTTAARSNGRQKREEAKS